MWIWLLKIVLFESKKSDQTVIVVFNKVYYSLRHFKEIFYWSVMANKIKKLEWEKLDLEFSDFALTEL